MANIRIDFYSQKAPQVNPGKGTTGPAAIYTYNWVIDGNVFSSAENGSIEMNLADGYHRITYSFSYQNIYTLFFPAIKVTNLDTGQVLNTPGSSEGFSICDHSYTPNPLYCEINSSASGALQILVGNPPLPSPPATSTNQTSVSSTSTVPISTSNQITVMPVGDTNSPPSTQTSNVQAPTYLGPPIKKPSNTPLILALVFGGIGVAGYLLYKRFKKHY